MFAFPGWEDVVVAYEASNPGDLTEDAIVLGRSSCGDEYGRPTGQLVLVWDGNCPSRATSSPDLSVRFISWYSYVHHG